MKHISINTNILLDITSVEFWLKIWCLCFNKIV